MSNSRNNDSRSAFINDQVFASGTFKNVYAGRYNVGTRAGQECVAKEFKTGSVYEKHYFEQEMNVIRRTQRVIDNWHSAGIIDKRVLLNNPQIWTDRETGAKVQIEPMIQNFEKFNSNSGWASISGGAWSEAMQALSHFSYHNSGGQVLLCDLQGGCYQDGYILSDPVIMSPLQTYGPTDLGPDGIRSFFHRHRCGRFCKRDWLKPGRQNTPLFPMTRGTTMVARLPTRSSRNPLTRLQE
ncbi:kinase-like domain-containing protein [Xylaria flabelliformis]|nr:kinase-like domain-containing protein [Xylaria flabelliformis]